MADVRPFRGIRYDPQRFGQNLSEVVCPPYDVISPPMHRWLYERSPFNVVRLELPMDENSRNRYESAARQYRAWLHDGTLRQEQAPALYAYLQSFAIDGVWYERRAIIGAVRLEPWERQVVRPHERTLAGPKRDRLQLMRACRANFSPIWGLYRDEHGATEEIWAVTRDRDPDAEATDSDNVLHRVWAVPDRGAVDQMHASLAASPMYIADGHHRYETALHYRSEVLAGSGSASEDAAANFAMTYLVECGDPGLVVLGTHRMLRSPRPLDGPMLRRSLEERFDLQKAASSPVELLAQLEAHADGPAFAVWAPQIDLAALARLRGSQVPEALAAGHSAAWRRLDLAALHTVAIDQLFPEGTSALSESGLLSYTRTLEDVERAVRSGEADLAFLVRRTPVEQILSVADAGDLMPEKSTYFYPKPVTGMVISNLEGEVALPA